MKLRPKSKTIKEKHSDRIAKNTVIAGLFELGNLWLLSINSGSSEQYAHAGSSPVSRTIKKP